MATTAGNDASPTLDRVGDVRFTSDDGFLRDKRPNVDAGTKAGTHRQLTGATGDRFNEGLVERCVDEESVHGQAVLSRRSELRLEGTLEGGIACR